MLNYLYDESLYGGYDHAVEDAYSLMAPDDTFVGVRVALHSTL
jgi:hypothetical protein